MDMRAVALLSLGAWALGSCNNGADGEQVIGGGATTTTSVDILVQDAPTDRLLSFEADVDRLELVGATGGQTGNLLKDPLRVEFLGLAGTPAWLARAEIPAGEYRGLRLRFDPDSVRARTRNGQEIPVETTSDTLVVDLAQPLELTEGGYDQFVLDLNVADSVSGAVANPPLMFDPVGALVAATADGFELDEFLAVLERVGLPTARLEVLAYADGDMQVPLGTLTLQLSNATHAWSEDDTLYQTLPAFLASLVEGESLLEVHGNLRREGEVDVARIEVENRQGGMAAPVKIEALVASVESEWDFRVLVREIESQREVAEAVLESLGSPSRIDVTYDELTLLLLDDEVQSEGVQIAVGQELKLKFASFDGEPFLVTQIELLDVPETEGVITDVSELPDRIRIQALAGEPALESGAVFSGETEILVNLEGALLTLDVDGSPGLEPAELQVGQAIGVRGALFGPAVAPRVNALRAAVHPGRLEGLVDAVDADAGTFSVSVTAISAPFGDNAGEGPLTVRIVPGALFEDDAASAADLIALFEGLMEGQTLEVEVLGIAAEEQDLVDGYKIEVDLRTSAE